MSSQMKSVSKARLMLVFGVLIAGMLLCLFGLFAAGNWQYLSYVGLGVVILAVILQMALIQCPYCGHRTVTKFYNPSKRTGQCPSCNKRFRIQ